MLTAHRKSSVDGFFVRGHVVFFDWLCSFPFQTPQGEAGPRGPFDALRLSYTKSNQGPSIDIYQENSDILPPIWPPVFGKS